MCLQRYVFCLFWACYPPFVINGIVVGSARRYILEPQETEQVNADCVIALGAMVWGKDTLSHMLEDRVLGAIDVYERGGAKKNPDERGSWARGLR